MTKWKESNVDNVEGYTGKNAKEDHHEFKVEIANTASPNIMYVKYKNGENTVYNQDIALSFAALLPPPSSPNTCAFPSDKAPSEYKYDL